MRSPRRLLELLLVMMVTVMVTFVVGAAHAQTTPTDAVLPRELDALGAWLQAKEKPTCSDHCFVLSKMKLGGSVEKGLTFELEGAVLAESAVAIPLFGPPDRVRIENATVDGAAAAIGFEGDHYYLFTSQKHFVLKGSLTLQGERALTVSGPLNVLEADLAEGRVAEGARISGLASTTLHFDGATSSTEKPAEPPVFQLSRHLHVERQATFEYRLSLRAGTDLGVVRLPLVDGERVIDVGGSTGWKIEGTDLVLPTAGHSAEITITGNFDALADKTFAPDARSTFEWVQIDADAEHRVTVGGEAKQVDAGESPFPRTTVSRLFLLQKGQTLTTSVQTLGTVEALTAVVQNDGRIVVLTPRGDLVSDQTIAYENNGIDYLPFAPDGRPIFLAGDGVAEKILRDGDGTKILAPLQKGVHSLRVQTISQGKTSLFGGKLVVSAPEYPLTASRSTLTFGLPSTIHPIAVLGGDKPQWFVGWEDVAAIVVAIVAAWSLWKARSRRLLCAAILVGVWFLSTTAFACIVAALLAAVAARVLARLAHGKSLRALRWALVAGVAVFGLFGISTLGRKASERTADVEQASEDYRNAKDHSAPATDVPVGGNVGAQGSTAPVTKMPAHQDEEAFGKKTNAIDGDDGKLADALLTLGGELEANGVRPVALPLPAYERSVTVSRELVTRDRPFHPTLLYVTDWALLPFGVAWIAAIATLVLVERKRILELRDRARTWLAERPTPVPPEAAAPAAPPATPPTTT